MALTILAGGSTAQAGAYTEDLSKCLVSSSSAADQAKLVAWIYAAMSAHPDIRAYSNITAAQRDAVLKDAGALVQRLLTVDCRAQASAALKNEGASALDPAFSTLGAFAMRNLVSNPEVSQAMAIDKYMDVQKLQDLGKEAGVERSK
jgi:hypothetical protein